MEGVTVLLRPARNHRRTHKSAPAFVSALQERFGKCTLALIQTPRAKCIFISVSGVFMYTALTRQIQDDFFKGDIRNIGNIRTNANHKINVHILKHNAELKPLISQPF